jgi:glycosyltransferase involved in cell wall biosynthesis
MRVLMVAPTPFFGDRGCHIRILEEIRALRPLGVDVLVATYPVGRDVPGVRTVRGPALPWVRQLPVGFSPHRPYLDLLLLGTALRAARRFRPDVVHGHLHEGAVLGAALARGRRRPLVADLQGSLTGELTDHGTLPRSGPATRAARRLERAIVQRPARVLASSAAFARELREVWGVPAARIVALPDGVDPEVFRPGLAAEDLRRRFNLEGRRVVAFLGVLTASQGVDDLLAAWPAVIRAVPDAHLLLMGYPNEARYRSRVTEAGLGASVTVAGRIDYALAPRHLALATVAVSPKRSATEANGKLLNYMAAGLPTVAYDSPVAREILGDAGLLAPMGDVAALARALATLLDDPAECRRRGDALRDRAVAEFGWPHLARRLLDVYRDARE